MLHFLSSVFAAKQGQNNGPEDALIERAIERVVDGTDPRLRGLGNYRKRLRTAVEIAVVHVIAVVDAFPEPVEISRRAYRTDPRLRAFFVSADHLQETIGRSKAVKDYVRAVADPLPDEIFGFLTMEWQEKNVLGMALEDDTLRRDVPQVSVNFFNHRYLGAAGSEAEARRQVEIRIFDYLIERALRRIVGARSKRTELENQRRLLQRKLSAMKAGNWGLEPMLAASEIAHPDHRALESEIETVEAQLLELGTRPFNLEAYFEDIDETLGRPADWIARREIQLNLDHMLIKVDGASDRCASQLELIELSCCSGARRIVLPGRFPRQDLPEQADFLKQAERYLH
jgi:hypothetical protein